jgi:cathepsin C
MENTCNIKELPHIYRARNYRYIGGSYGKCSQKSMMEELYKNGPIVVSFEPDYNFMMYKSGIYHSIDEKTWINKGIPKPEWEKVDHSVLLVGWGEEESGEKYWILQNTWGPSWGENGFFRMKRGNDEFGIESICEAADPYIVDNITGKELDINKIKQDKIDDIYNNNNFLDNYSFNGEELAKNISNSNQNDSRSIFDQLIV